MANKSGKNPAEQSPPQSRSAESSVGRWQARWGLAVWLMWGLNLLLLLGVIAWISSDGRSHLMMRYLEAQVGFQPSDTYDEVTVVDWSSVAGPMRAMQAIALTAIASLVGIFLGLFTGLPQQRNMKAWLALTFLFASWLTLGTAWREVHWWGQQVRLRGAISAVEPIATSLEESWPQREGTHPDLGRFLAYPSVDPRALLLLTHADVSGARFTIAAVERSPDGILRFELADSEEGVWLERRDAGTPESFVGGVGTRYTYLRSAHLRGDWYLVRYRS